MPVQKIQNIKYLKVGLFNIHSVRNKLTLLNEILLENSLDILFVCETWLHDSERDNLRAALPDNYSFEHAPRSDDPKVMGGGVAIIFRNCFSKVKILPKFHSTTSFEALSCAFYSSNLILNTAVVYRPGHPGTDLLFFHEFNEFLSSFTELGSHFLICGDFNYWINNPSAKPSTINFIETLSAHNCINSIKEPTHIAGNTLDLVIHDSENNAIDNRVVFPIDSKHSDHSLITFNYNIPTKEQAASKTIKFRNYKNLNLNQLKCDVTNAFSSINQYLEPNSLVNNFNSELLSLYDHHCPTIEKVIRVKQTNPWFDSSVAKLRKERRQCEREWRKRGCEFSRIKYVKARSRVVDEVEKKKKEYFNNEIKNCSSNQKKLWGVINRLTGLQEHMFPSNATSDDINNYFINKIEYIRKHLNDITHSKIYSNTVLTHCNVDNTSRELTEFCSLSESEVVKIVNSVNKTYCSLDPFNFSKVPEILPLLIPIFTAIINNCFSLGVFPDSEKIAVVRPLLKKPTLEKNDLKNFRPVSNLTYLSKLIEKAIQYQLVPHLNANKCISDFQSAYRQHHSTETALCRIYNDLLLNIQESKPSILILLDLSAAFDTIDHSLLINDLKNAGVNGKALSLLESYLRDRYQKVLIDNPDSISSPLHLQYGVPQGSVLGPVLFSLYSSKLAKIMAAHDVSYHLYADDTQIYMPVTDIDSSQLKITAILSDIKLWMHERKLKLNEGKTEIIFINGTLNNDILTQSQNTTLIKDIRPSTSIRDLGLIIDSKLSFSDHFNSVIKTCNYHLRRLSSIVKYLDKESATTLMHAFITSRVDYCNALFVNLPKKDLMRLQLILNRAARLIFNLPPFESISSYLYELHWLPVKARIEFKLCLLVYKALKFKQPSYIYGLLNHYSSHSNVTLRAADDPHLLIVPRLQKHSSFGSRTLSYAGPKLFNKLPFKIRDAGNTDIFKKLLKTHMFNKAYDSVTKTINLEYKT